MQGGFACVHMGGVKGGRLAFAIVLFLMLGMFLLEFRTVDSRSLK